MRTAEEAVARIRPWVDFFYLFSSLWPLLVLLHIPSVPPRWGGLQQSFLLSMLLMAISTFPVSWWLSEKFLGENALVETDRLEERVRTGALVMGAMGEACAVYGYAMYCVSGDTRRPCIFWGLTVLHYLLTRYRLARVDRG